MGAKTLDMDVVHAVASRRANLYLRLGSPLAIALILDISIHMRWVWLWAALYVGFVLLEAGAAAQIGRRPAAQDRLLRFCLTTLTPFVASAIFGFLAVPLFASEIRFAPTLGGMLLAGALMNVVIVNAQAPSAMIAAATPLVLYFLVIPLIARWANPDAPLAHALWLGALLLVTAVAVSARTLRSALKAEASAKDEAERRRYEAEEAVDRKSVV